MDRPSPTLLTAKTRVPPPRRGLVYRSGLVQRLSDGQDQALTIVRAPAGYGKTTLLQQWAVNDDTRRFAWVQLDPTDNDPVLFWRYILAAFRGCVRGLAESAWTMLGGPAPDLDAAITDLLNDLLDEPEGLVLVLDDYHVIDNPECHRTIKYFIDHITQNTQVAIASRVRLPFSVSRLIARGLVTDIGSHDLELTSTETAAAVRLTVPTASARAISRIYERTEGWPVGVYLSTFGLDAGASVADGASGDATITQRYLVDEMLSHLDVDDRDFVRETSILERLSGDVCDHVTHRTDSAEVLARLESANLLLIPLDDVGIWYRYHHLLREVFQPEITSDSGSSMLHRRAAAWFLSHDDASLAIHHAIEAGQLLAAGDLICAHWSEYIFTGRLETVRRWLIHYPTSAVLEHPPLIVASAWIAAFSGDVDETIRFARAAEIASYSGETPDRASSYESSVALLLGALALDGVRVALAHAQTAYQNESPDSPWRAMAAVLKGTVLSALGESREARTALLEAAETPAGPVGLATYTLGQLALLEINDRRWEAAEEYANSGRNLIDKFELHNLISSGAAYAASAAVEAHKGNVTEARRQLQFLAPVLARLSDAFPFDAFQIHLVAGETYFAIDDVDAARIHARAAEGSLASLGDGGILADRLDILRNGLPATENGSPDLTVAAPDLLTARELQILALLPTTMSLREIGDQLYVSRNTVKTHVARLYRKLGVSNRITAVTRGRELELI